METAIQIQNVWKIFGERPQDALRAIREKGLSKAQVLAEYNAVVGVADVNLSVNRGEIFCIMGLSGSGKSTLVRLLLDIDKPDSGRVRHGFDLIPAYFDQRRETLDRDRSPWTTLSEDGSDMIKVAGRTKHVTSYLRDFMFDDVKMNQRVSTLSGGEQNRLLLAKLFAQSHNFLVLDEPTNDLDIATIEILEQSLLEFKGAILLISHDRYLMGQVCQRYWGFCGRGALNAYASVSQWIGELRKKDKEPRAKNLTEKTQKELKKSPVKLSYKEKRAVGILY